MIGPSLGGGLILGLERSQLADLIRRGGNIKLDSWTEERGEKRWVGDE